MINVDRGARRNGIAGVILIIRCNNHVERAEKRDISQSSVKQAIDGSIQIDNHHNLFSHVIAVSVSCNHRQF